MSWLLQPLIFPSLLLVAFAGSVSAQAPMPYRVDSAPRSDAAFHENKLEVSFETAQLFDVGGAEVFYHVAPQILSLHWQLDEVGNEGWLRGNTEFIFGGYFTPVIQGVESRYTGGLFGPRYNFVQPGSEWVPYLESRVGFGFTDSRADQRGKGQGQDFFFTFTVGMGTRYLINDHAQVSLGVIYQHISNAGLSEPERINHGLDTLGPILSLSYAF